MHLKACAAVALILCWPASASEQQQQSQQGDSILAAICDQAAASPLDNNRPAGVAGVAPDKIDPKIAIPACDAALKASPDNYRMMFQLGRAYGAAKSYELARDRKSVV